MSTTNVKQILCLANSRKYGGRCVVGKEMLPDRTLAWVRPVSDTEKGEVMPEDMQYADETEPALLDVIEVPVSGPLPLPYQPENWLIEPGQWRKDRQADISNIDRWVDPPGSLWGNGNDSALGGSDSAMGKNDRFLYDPERKLPDSARFIGVPALEIRVTEHTNDAGRTNLQLRGAFTYENESYVLRITDVEYEDRFQQEGVGTYGLGKSYLTVTVGEPFRRVPGEPEYHYKLIAAIIEV